MHSKLPVFPVPWIYLPTNSSSWVLLIAHHLHQHRRRPIIDIRLTHIQASPSPLTVEKFGNPLCQKSWKEILNQLLALDVPADSATCASLVECCGNAKSLGDGKHVHQLISKCGLEGDSFLAGLLVQMYGKCGALEEARGMFAKMQQKDPFLWNYMITLHLRHGQGKKALELFHHLQREGMIPDKFIFASSLSVCAGVADLAKGRQLHARIAGGEFELDVVVGTALVNMYGKCGNLEAARKVFDKMHTRNIFSWNAMIAAYTQHGLIENGVRLFDQMQQEGMMPDNVTFISLLALCANQAAIIEGERLHVRITGSGFELDVVVSTALITMYAKCAHLEDAKYLFDKMPQRDLLSWNTMIAAYAQSEQGNNALQLFTQMQREDVMPNKVSFISVLSCCARQGALAEGKQVHSSILKIDLDSDDLVRTALITMYGKCGSCVDARTIFNKMSDPDAFACNVMIVSYAQHGHSKEALLLFSEMEQEGMLPDKVLFTSVLSLCAGQTFLAVGKQFHARIRSGVFQTDVVVDNALINMYIKCAGLEDALSIFDSMPERNLFSWNAMIGGYGEHGLRTDTHHLFDQMRQESVMPNSVTFISMLSSCSYKSALYVGKQIHAIMTTRQSEWDVVMDTALLKMYAKCGSIEHAQNVFDEMGEKNMFSWTTLMASYIQCGKVKDAMQLFDRMQLEGGAPDKVTFICILSACTNLEEGKRMHVRLGGSLFVSDSAVANSLINMYGNCGSLELAHWSFDNMGDQNTVSWNALIGGYVQNSQSQHALQLFNRMQAKRVALSSITFVNVLSACACHAAILEGKRIHGLIEGGELESDVVVGTAILNMYSKCGSLKDARSIFDQMPERNTFSWNVMIAAYGQHGQVEEAFKLFTYMQQQGVNADSVTFVSMLSACSHTGLVDKGYDCFVSMIRDHSITPLVEHYNCMIDLFGRAGRLSEAEMLLIGMSCHPTNISWTALLGACREQFDLERGECAAMRLLERHPYDAAPYIMLSNIYVVTGRDNDGVRMMNSLKENGLKWQPACASIVDGNVHEFLAANQLHLKKDQVYSELQRMTRNINDVGSIFDISSTPFSWEDEIPSPVHSQ